MQEKDRKPIAKIRRAVRHGKTLYVSLPKKFVKLHEIEPRERLPIIWNHTMLKIIPTKEK